MPVPMTSYLKKVITADAVISGAAGVAMMAGSTFLPAFTGLPGALLFWAGLALVPFVIELAMILRMKQVPSGFVMAVIAINIAWVAASLFIAFGPTFQLTLFGKVFVTVQALVVALFAELQIIGLKRARIAV
jgi:hypothetical protein